ncbi:MAG: hypothetical protein HOW97_17040 [Catenulispora sp.]|nr:hypothetical protein [Catenulispora sp.]
MTFEPIDWPDEYELDAEPEPRQPRSPGFGRRFWRSLTGQRTGAETCRLVTVTGDDAEADVRAVAALLKLGDVSFLGTWLTDYDDARSELESRFADRIAALNARDTKEPTR